MGAVWFFCTVFHISSLWNKGSPRCAAWRSCAPKPSTICSAFRSWTRWPPPSKPIEHRRRDRRRQRRRRAVGSVCHPLYPQTIHSFLTSSLTVLNPNRTPFKPPNTSVELSGTQLERGSTGRQILRFVLLHVI